METIKRLFNNLHDTVTPNPSGAIRLPDHDDRISLYTVNDEPYNDNDDNISNNDIQNDASPPYIQFTTQQLYSDLRLDPSIKSIRVLDIDPPPSSSSLSPDAPLQGTLRVVRLSDFPAFTALSYTWGPYSSPAVDTIRCNGTCDIPITKNGRDALLALRRRHYAGWRPVRTTGPLTIWVDAVCINQDDDTEKAGQIALMADVYTWARTVWVWLGSGDERTARAVKGLKRAARLRIEPVGVPWIEEDMYAALGGSRSLAYYKAQLAKSMIQVFLRTYFLFLLAIPRQFLCACGLARTRKEDLLGSGDIGYFLDREWTERAWTFQEVVLASNPVIVCGEEAISWAQLQQGLDCLNNMRPSFAGRNSRTGHKGWVAMRYYLFKGWATSKDLRTESEIDSWVDESLGKINVSEQWSNLFQVWKTVSRPTGWNGRVFRSVPKKLFGPEEDGGNGLLQNGPSANYFSVKEYEGQLNAQKVWTWTRLIILLLYVGPLILLLVGVVWVGRGPAFGSVLGKIVASIFLLSPNYLPLVVYITLLMGRPTIGATHAPRSEVEAEVDVNAASGLVAIVRVLRDRKAQNAHDKSFATHGVLERLSLSVPPADYKKPLGKVYHELYVELVKREPSYIALLCDVKGSVLPGAPSWVPDWGSEKLRWAKEDAIYKRIEDPSRSAPSSTALAQLNANNTELVVGGLFIGEISYTSRPIGCDEPVDGAESAYRGSLIAIDEWRREVVELYGRQTPRCEYNPSSVSMVLCPSHQPSPEEWIEEDFRRWHKLLTSPGYDDASSRYELIELALSERDPQARRFTEKVCRGFGGTASLFVSDDGFVGKGPKGIEKGDEIYLVDGVGQPMILRKEGDEGKYRVMGPAFVCQHEGLYTFEDGDREILDSNRWVSVTLV